MARIEELPDNFEESLDLGPPPESGSSSSILPDASGSIPFPIGDRLNGQDGPAPSLPPHMASVRSHTADEIVKMMNRTPLFMTSLEDTEGEGTWDCISVSSRISSIS